MSDDAFPIIVGKWFMLSAERVWLTVKLCTQLSERWRTPNFKAQLNASYECGNIKWIT